ncbi:MAG: hypothetical protein KatS3mg012_0590 [Gaiellaceae bacterium]|jgi:hypothetical protein|nr:MAG: hypothetical protein KatS3mg012_0590 [Gaiellaceae bacterium]
MSVTQERPYLDCISGSWLAERLGWTPERIEILRRAGELVAVREPGSLDWLYPAWQFAGRRPRPGVARVVAAAREAGLDENELYGLLTAPLGLRARDGSRLVDLLVEGRVDEVVAAVRGA